ncbi:MAG: hypothetical protein MPEBLZ_04470, partial [Candidatus Methanoperedens nitroreducens]
VYNYDLLDGLGALSKNNQGQNTIIYDE